MIHGDAIRVGIHAGQQDASYAEFAELWERAEALGLDWISVFDHFRPIFADPTGRAFEGPTMLAALAAQTSRVRCGILVSGVTYRHPAVVANIAATIDHVSGGRLEWGIGAAWNELEHDQYGIPFPPIGIRLDMLDEACHILRGLWTQERFSFEGKHYRLREAQLNPPPVQERLPLLVGGSGERRTLRIVAEHADIWNTFISAEDEYRHKVAVLATHCSDVGRDPGDIRKSLALWAILGPTESDAKAHAETQLAKVPDSVRSTLFVGTTEQCVERLRPFAELGVRDFLFGLRAPFDWQTIELVAREVAPGLREQRR